MLTLLSRDKSIPLQSLAHSDSHVDYAWSDLDSISARSLRSGVESLPPSCPQSPIRPHLASPPPQFEPSESSSFPDVAPCQIWENSQDARDPHDPRDNSDSESVGSEYASARSRTSTPVEAEPEEFMRGVSVQSDLPELKPSDGRRKARGVRWPKRGKNTRKGRMVSTTRGEESRRSETRRDETRRSEAIRGARSEDGGGRRRNAKCICMLWS
jgi:hypothetical protein